MRYQPLALPPPAFERRLATLRFRFAKWDTHVGGRCTVMPGALVLTLEEHAGLVRLAEGLDRLARGMQARLAARGPEEAAAAGLGLPRGLRRLASADGLRGVTRFDLFPTPQGWMASEFNADVPGGYNDAIGLPAVLEGDVEKGLAAPGDLPQALTGMLRDAAGGGAVGLVYATAYAEDLQVVRLLAALLEAEGTPAVLASPDALRWRGLGRGPGGDATLAGEPVAAAFRFFPAEWYPLLPNLRDWEAAAEAGWPVVNPFSAAWPQSKAAFGWLRGPEAPAGEHAAALAALPETLPLTPELAAEAAREPERWVLKPAFGRMGAGVVLGAREPPEAWRKRLHAALREAARRPFVLQRRFHVTPVELGDGRTGTPCVGVYVVQGRFAGYYSRISKHPVVGHDAANLLTLVEGL